MSTDVNNPTREEIAEQLYQAYMEMFAATHESLLDLTCKDPIIQDFLSSYDQPESRAEFVESVMQLDEFRISELRDVLSDYKQGSRWANRITNRMIKAIQRS